VIIVAAIAYGIGGYRNGALIGAFSLVGFFGGAVLGAQFARPLGSRLAQGQAQVPIAIVCVLMCALIGQLIGVWVAGRLRQAIRWRPAQAVDSGIGAALGVVAVLLVAWMVAVPLASSPYPALASAVRRSAIVRSVDGVIPTDVRTLYSSLRRYIDRSGFPPVFGDLQSTRIVDVPTPSQSLTTAEGVTVDRASTVEIFGTSQSTSCNRVTEGSGFFYAPRHILTNAHVVAGAQTVQIGEAGLPKIPARVVLFDAKKDVAVLYTPTLNEPALSFAPTPAKTKDDAIVLGYPQAGPFNVQPARIRDRGTIVGHDIYGEETIEREIYSIRSLVRSGNSGGPLITRDGQVLGIVFATALDSTDTGFVLTYNEISADAGAAETAQASVSTQDCT
jgi:S1-C subfamily serine protease